MPEFEITVTKTVKIVASALSINEARDAVLKEIQNDFSKWTFEDKDWEWAILPTDASHEYIIDNTKIIHIDDY